MHLVHLVWLLQPVRAITRAYLGRRSFPVILSPVKAGGVVEHPEFFRVSEVDTGN